MKSTNLMTATLMFTTLLLLAQHTEAKNNYSNKIAIFEEKPKTETSASIHPSTTLEVLPELTTRNVYNFLDKYTPEQLNRLMGVWPEHKYEAETKARNLSKNENASDSETSLNDYSPEQFVNILGLTF